MNECKVTARKSGGAIIGTLIRGDNGTAAVRVVIPRYANGVDLAPLVWSVHVANASGTADVVIPAAVTADDASVMFEWLPGGVATAAAGMTEVHFEGVDEGALVWASATYHLRIDDKNDATPSGEDAQKLTELQQLIVFVSGELNGVIEAGRAAQEAANRANEAAERAESIGGTVVDATLTRPGAAADAAVVGRKFDKLSEEIVKLPEQVKQDVIESLTKFDVEGDFVQFTPKEDSVIKVVTTFTGHNPYWGHHELHQVTSKNLHDFVNRLGGVGTVIEKDGLKAVINDDYTVTITGTNTSSGWVNIVEGINTPGYNDYVYPRGTYTTPDKLVVQLISTDGLTNFGNKQKTFTVDAPFRIRGAYIAYAAGGSANETIPLCMVRGTVIPQTDYKYSGKVYKTYFTKKYAEGTYDWSTGNLYDTDGNLLETTAVVGISTLAGENSMWVGNGTVKATGDTAGMSISDSGSVEAFDPELWGLPILRLAGETQAMNKDNAVELSYVFGSRQGTCTVKWQGSSSIAYPKKNYTIKFDNAFEAAEGWGEQKKYCAKANWIDHSHSRNVVNAKLWGQVVKSRKNVPAELTNLVNGGAVDGFPIFIMINDELKGLYTFNIPKDGWMFGMGSGTNEAIICADKWVPATYYKAEAKIDGTDFKLEYATDEDDAGWVTTSMNRLINACMASDGSDLDTTIAQYLDWDSAIDYLIFTVMIVGSDMTGKNYLNATFDGTKWYFSAYDMDCTYCLSTDGSKFLPANQQPSFEQFAASHRVMELIVNYKKDALKARYAELRETVLSESNIATEFANFAGIIPSPVLMHDAKLWPGVPNTSVNNISQVRDAYRLRCAYADKWMEEL